MIWLNHNGSVQPFGSQVASNVSIGGRGYNVWFGNQGWNTISYTMTSPAASVSNLDIDQLVADAVSRGAGAHPTGADPPHEQEEAASSCLELIAWRGRRIPVPNLEVQLAGGADRSAGIHAAVPLNPDPDWCV